jgi:hypothetical protein
MRGVSRKSMTATMVRAAIVAALLIVVGAGAAQAQATNPFPDFFKLERPGHAEATLFAGGFGSDKYGTTQEGFQIEQSVTRYIGVFGRVTGYQLWIGGGFASPLNPSAGSFSRLNFGRLQAGIDFAPLQGTHLFISGGHDVGDSDAYAVEGDLGSWLFVRSLHPVSLTASALHDTQNGVSSGAIDLQAVLLTRERYLLLAGAGGAIYGGGFLTTVEGQGGPDLTFYYRPWALGLSVQAGYGDAHQYGQISIFNQFGWSE